MVTFDSLKLSCRRAASLYRIASGPHELASVTAFALKYVAIPLAPRMFRDEAMVRVQGHTYAVALRRGEVATFEEIYLDRVYDTLPDFVPHEGWTVFDLGANVGVFSVAQASRGADVYAFEPNPECYRRMMRTVVANNLPGRVQALEYAVGAVPGAGVLLRDGTGFTVLGSVVPQDGHHGAARVGDTAVRMTSLDQIVPALGVSHIDLLKIDVEGGEVEVLRGATKTLLRVDRVILEYHSRDLLEHVDAQLRDAGFVVVLPRVMSTAPDGGILFARRQVA